MWIIYIIIFEYIFGEGVEMAERTELAWNSSKPYPLSLFGSSRISVASWYEVSQEQQQQQHPAWQRQPDAGRLGGR